MRRALRIASWCLVVAGALGWAWTAWLLVGTNVVATHQQARVVQKLQQQHSVAPAPPRRHEDFAVISIPKIGLTAPILEGVDPADLKRGVGHYPGTPMPGAVGNVALAGHRTTYGRPFWDIQKLVPGDVITITRGSNVWRYTVTGHFTVTPDQVGVAGPLPGHVLTITTCTPRFSASHRYVLRALLAG